MIGDGRRHGGCRLVVWPAEDGCFALGREAETGFEFSQNENCPEGLGGVKKP